MPTALLAQARTAARSGIGLDTVLRRYFAGYALLGDFLIEETERQGILDGAQLKRLLRAQASIFDRLLAEVSEEYGREEKSAHRTSESRRIELVERLLAGEPLNTEELGYDLGGHHLGLVATGQDAPVAIRALARALDRRLLLLQRQGGTTWAWLGGRKPIPTDVLEAHLRGGWPEHLLLSYGESGKGSAGWRLTHRQAAIALPIALRGSEPWVRYADVALLASIAQDDLLTVSLKQVYLEPLERERDGGENLRQTLRAYFSCARNSTSAAAELGVSRQTVTRHLHMVECHLARPLDSCATEIEAALRLEEMFQPVTYFSNLCVGSTKQRVDLTESLERDGQ